MQNPTQTPLNTNAIIEDVKLSVILPAYNAEQYISDAVKSVLSQSFKEFELIVVNDGSTDNTIKILNDFKDCRLKVFSKTNGGIVSALNFGFLKSSGKIIARMDADDICYSNRFEKQLTYLTENDLDMIGCYINLIDKENKIIGQKKYPVNHYDILASLPFFNPFCHPTTIYKRDVFSVVGGYQSNKDGAEDFDLWCRLSKSFRLGNCPEILLKYRITPNSLSRTSYEHRMALCRDSIITNLAFPPLVFYSISNYLRHPVDLFVYATSFAFKTKFKSFAYILIGLTRAMYAKIILFWNSNNS